MNYARNAGKILCIGRNYAAHIKELGNCASSEPFFFLKPSSSVLAPGSGPLLIPKGTTAHHEVELAFTLNRNLKNLPSHFSHQDALESIGSYALVIDMTARNVQEMAKKKGLPWSIAKGFDTFLPLSNSIDSLQIPDPYAVDLKLSVNGKLRQSDRTNLMIFPIHEILRYMSAIMTLEKGDMVLTGTPKGVGPVIPGDHVLATLSIGGKELERIELEAAENPGPYNFVK